MIFHFYSKTGVFSILKKEDCNQLKKKRSDFDFSFLFCRLLLCVGPLDFFLYFNYRSMTSATNKQKKRKKKLTDAAETGAGGATTAAIFSPMLT
jgi:hypothetical protein